MGKLDPLEVIVRGPHNSGKTTAANLIRTMFLEFGFKDVTVSDVDPLPDDQKPEMAERLRRNMSERPIQVKVEVLGPALTEGARSLVRQVSEFVHARAKEGGPTGILDVQEYFRGKFSEKELREAWDHGVRVGFRVPVGISIDGTVKANPSG